MSWCGDILLGAHLVKIIGSCESQKVRDNLIDTTKKKWTKNGLFLCCEAITKAWDKYTIRYQAMRNTQRFPNKEQGKKPV